MVGDGREKVEGGGRGRCEALHQDGRSPGRRAAVQSRPTHQRWFSYTVKRKRRGGEGGGAEGTSGSGLDRALVYSVRPEAGREAYSGGGEGVAGGGRGVPEKRA